MSRYQRQKDFFHGKAESIGVLLVNLGTPEQPETGALRRYLREFLADSRVVEIPRLIWYPILYGAILPRRPVASAAKYRAIWTDKGSPLLVIGREQQQGLQTELERLLQGEIGRIRDVQQGPDGYVWLLNDEADGGLYRLETVQ